MYPNVRSAINNTQPPPHNKFKLDKLGENACYYNEDIAWSLLQQLSIHPIMAMLFIILRRIHHEFPTYCPIEIVLTVSMLEFIVAYGAETAEMTGDELESYIEFIRLEWQKVGTHINLGHVPTGKLLHFMLAFATSECMKYTDGTDLLDKEDPNNHTVKYADRNICHDYLNAIGYDCTKEEAQDFISEYASKSDAWVECGLINEGNVAKDYAEQANTRFEPFSTRYEHLLKIVDGPSIIDKTRYWHYKGIHFTAGVGLLNVVLGAFLTCERHPNERMRLVVQSTRARRLLFVCEGDENAVICNPLMIICPFIHPNSHQRNLGNLEEEEVELLDRSYSTAFKALDGEQIIVQGEPQVFTAALSDSSTQRRAINKKIKEEAKENSIDPDERAAYERVKTLEKRLIKHERLEEKKKRQKVLTFILSTYPEGAYVRDFHGKYPLDYATTNKDIPTRKLALAALDRGTLYASISKMTSLRLSKENESKTRSMEEVYEKKLNKMESHAKEERAKLVAQLDSMTKQLKEEKESNQALCEEKEKMAIEKDQAVARAIQFERARYAKLEEQLRSDLADVQLKNMDLLDQLESTQGDLDASKETEEKHVGEIDALKQQLSETNNKLDGAKDEFYMTQEELETVQVELVAATNVIKQKSARITHLEQSLENTKSSVLHLIQEHERAQANMEKQKEYLGIFINQQINAEKEAKTSLLKMSLLVDAIDVSQRVEGNLEKVVVEEGAMIDASTMTVKEVLEEKSELAEESQ